MANGLMEPTEEVLQGAVAGAEEGGVAQDITSPESPPPGNAMIEASQELVQDYYRKHPQTADTLGVNATLGDADVPINPADQGNATGISEYFMKFANNPVLTGTPTGKKIFDFANDLSEGAENIKLGWNEFMSDVSDIKGDELANMRHYMGAQTDEDGNIVYPEDQTTFDNLLSMRKYASDRLTSVGGTAINKWDEILAKSLNKLSHIKNLILYPSVPGEKENWARIKEQQLIDSRNKKNESPLSQELRPYSERPTIGPGVPEGARRPVPEHLTPPGTTTGPYDEGMHGPAADYDYFNRPASGPYVKGEKRRIIPRGASTDPNFVNIPEEDIRRQRNLR